MRNISVARRAPSQTDASRNLDAHAEADPKSQTRVKVTSAIGVDEPSARELTLALADVLEDILRDEKLG